MVRCGDDGLLWIGDDDDGGDGDDDDVDGERGGELKDANEKW